MAEHERCHVFYAGNVQGVGFRYTTNRIASNHAVTGYVQNLSDGRVELLAEGPPAELRAFLREIEDTMHGNIREAQVDRRPATGEFQRFEVRHGY